MNGDVDWARFVSEARHDPAKEAVLWDNRLPRWLLTALLTRPFLTGPAMGVAAGACVAMDRPVDWWFVGGTAVVGGAACVFSGLVVRRRIRRFLRSGAYRGGA